MRKLLLVFLMVHLGVLAAPSIQVVHNSTNQIIEGNQLPILDNESIDLALVEGASLSESLSEEIEEVGNAVRTISEVKRELGRALGIENGQLKDFSVFEEEMRERDIQWIKLSGAIAVSVVGGYLLYTATRQGGGGGLNGLGAALFLSAVGIIPTLWGGLVVIDEIKDWLLTPAQARDLYEELIVLESALLEAEANLIEQEALYQLL